MGKYLNKESVKAYDDLVEKTAKKTLKDNTLAKTPKDVVDNIL